LDSKKLPFQFWEEKKIQNQRNLGFQFFSKTSNASSFIEGFIDWFFWCWQIQQLFLSIQVQTNTFWSLWWMYVWSSPGDYVVWCGQRKWHNLPPQSLTPSTLGIVKPQVKADQNGPTWCLGVNCLWNHLFRRLRANCLPSMCVKCCSKLVLSTEVARPSKSNYDPFYPKPQKPNTRTLDEICLLLLTLLHGFDTIE